MGEPFETAPTTAPKRSTSAPLVVSIATLVVVSVMLGLQVYWKYFELRWDGLANKVLSSMNQNLKSDSRYSNRSPNVTHLTVMHAAGNTFEGQATVAGSGVTSQDVNVHIVFDGENMFWRTDPGAFFFLAMGN